jgi:hypothetical protein
MEIEGIPHPLQGRARPAITTGGGIPALRGELPEAHVLVSSVHGGKEIF